MPGMDFLALLKKAGFQAANLVKLTGFKSSPYTEGALFYAEKPRVMQEKEMVGVKPDALTKVETLEEKAAASLPEKARAGAVAGPEKGQAVSSEPGST